MNRHAHLLRKSVAAAPRQVQLQLQLFDAKRTSATQLTDPRMVYVESAEWFQSTVSVRRERRSSHSRASTVDRLYVSGTRAGQYDRLGPVTPRELPMRVHGVRLKLSDGQTFIVHSRTVTVVTRWEQRTREDKSEYWFPHKATIMSDSVTMRLDRKLDWTTANRLRPGDPVTVEYAFQWVNGNLTNGVISFPPLRPHGQQWRNYPIDPVPESCWDDFLDGLEGKFMHELLPYHKEVTTRKPEQQRALTARQSDVERVIKGAMWKGDGCEQVAFGRNLLFIVKRDGREPVYVVDNAGYGAVYVFRDHGHAREFARGAITRSAAIKSGCLRVVHAGKWEARLSRILRAF